MSITDNTDTLNQILQEVYNLPERSNSSTTEDLILQLQIDIGSYIGNMTNSNVTYDTTEVINAFNKLVAGDHINVKMVGEYHYYSSGPYNGQLNSTHIEYTNTDWSKSLNITFLSMTGNSTSIIVYLKFTLNTDLSSVSGLSVSTKELS